MLHELLISLWGCSTSANDIVAADTIDFDKFLHPGEIATIKKILVVVQECNLIRKFIKSCTSGNQDLYTEQEKYKQGLYMQALCDGMDEALEPFRKDIVEMEQTVLDDAHTPITAVLCCVEKYAYLLKILNSIIREIQVQNLYGCKLLQCLHQYYNTGIPQVKAALQKMKHSIHLVFYKQLASWLLYGQLEDTYQEFFIGKSADTLGEMSVKETSGVCDEQTLKMQSFNEMWDYEVQIDMLPSYIQPSLASKILTIGQTVIMFSKDTRHKKDVNSIAKTENSIYGEQTYEYFGKLQKLQSKPVFAVAEFETTICEFKVRVEERLWQVAVEEAQLMQQLKLLKEFYLMGRGDLYLEFVKLSSGILNKTPTSHSTRDINLAFQVALSKIQINDENTADCFSFAVSVPPPEPQSMVELEPGKFSEREREDPTEKSGWGLISLTYKVIWPFHLLFSPKVMQDYNTLFRFLLRVKKTQISLWDMWRSHTHLHKIDMKLIQLRNTLILIVNNLQYYLQVNVLESQFAIMENKIKSTRSFEDVQQTHSIFLANVLSHMFLSDCSNMEKQNPVMKLLRLMLRFCDDFILQASVWKVDCLLDVEAEELKNLSATLYDLMGWLIKTLLKIEAQSHGQHLGELLLRLDFNRWFSNEVSRVKRTSLCESKIK